MHMCYLYPETDSHGAVFNSLLETIGMNPVVKSDLSYGYFGLEADRASSSDTSPKPHFYLPPTGPWSFGTLSGENLGQLLSNSNPDWYSNLLQLGAQCGEQFLDVVEETGYMRYVTSNRYSGYTQIKEESVASISVPNYKKRSAQGEIFNNPFSRSLLELSSTQIDTGWVSSERWSTAVSIVRGDKWGGQPYAVSCSSFAITRSRSLLCVPPEFLAALKSNIPTLDAGAQSAINNAFGNIQQGEVDLLVMAAEGKKTLQHLLSTVQRFTALVSAIRRRDISKLCPKTYKKMKKGAFDGAGGAKQMFEDAWMEARYAWLPLVFDAVGMFNIVTGNVTDRQTFRASSNDHGVNDLDFTVVTSAGPMKFTGSVTSIAGARAGVLTEKLMNSPLAQHLSVFNIATMVKEVIPFSFVLEWFINLSGLLYTLNPNPILRPLAAWCTVKDLATFQGTLNWAPTNGPELTLPITGKLDRKVREPVSEPGILTVDVNLGVARFIDGAILSLRALR
nr:MAG: hypothetical protein 1 [Leviviridae sp.]